MLFYALIKREKAFIGKLIGFKTCKQRIAEAGMDIFVKTDDAENAVELIKEIRNQEKQ